uniref:Uncharacterized protein n=1 Tax=Knipowitschia caucasica TaxID=637954 RepID=A0AAV2MJS5_KNICA
MAQHQRVSVRYSDRVRVLARGFSVMERPSVSSWTISSSAVQSVPRIRRTDQAEPGCDMASVPRLQEAYGGPRLLAGGAALLMIPGTCQNAAMLDSSSSAKT